MQRIAWGIKLTLEGDVNKTSQFYWMRVHFAQNLEPNKNYTFTVYSTLWEGLLTPTHTGTLFNMTAAPILTQDARTANVTFLPHRIPAFRLPTIQPTFKPPWYFPVCFSCTNPGRLTPPTLSTAVYTAVNQYLLNLNSVEREIVVGNDGTLGVNETYHFHNPSNAGTSLTITLADGAYNVMSYDEVGALWVSPENPSAPYQSNCQPRDSTGFSRIRTLLSL